MSRHDQNEMAANHIADWLVGGGEMGERIRSFDWAGTPIGPSESWSPALKTTVSILLANRFPLLLWWGPHYVSVYNDAYRPILGTKDPRALGQPVKDCWSEIWHILQPLIDTPFKGGPATWMEDIPLEINRYGFVEETHFTIAYSPVPDETVTTGIGGVLATVHEITEKVVGERRILALRDLAAQSADAKTEEEACFKAAETLAHHSKDVPFALLYVIDSERQCARLAGTAGVTLGAAASPQIISLDDSGPSDCPWSLAEAIRTETIHIVDDLLDRLGSSVPRGPWSDPPRQAVIVPIRSNVAHRLAGLLVAGVSARLKLDDLYCDFYELVSVQIATAIAQARAYEEERKRAEALAELDRAKTAFFSNISHEFRTPLTLMLGPVEDLLSRSNALPSSDKLQLEVVNRNGLRLLRLVNSLLDFSRIEAERVQAAFEATDLAAFTAELSSGFRSAIERAGLKLTVNCPPLSEPVYVDRDMWEKIVLNLLSNAFKFTFEGGIEVSLRESGSSAELGVLSSESAERANNPRSDHSELKIQNSALRSVTLRVRDTGVGIPTEALPRLFERFYRVENMHSRTHEGSGIGLALVNELVKLHGGSVRAESSLDKGSTFIVTVPLGMAHLPANQIGARRSHASTPMRAAPYVEEVLRWLPSEESSELEVLSAEWTAPSLSSEPDNSVLRTQNSELARTRPRVLMVDDNADMRMYITRLLAERYAVDTAPDGEAALAAVRAQRPDLVLSDVMMPNLDGFGLLRELRADPALRTIPVILLSARAGEESRIEGLEQGADDYLIKPFSARELLARVHAHLELARMRREAQSEVTRGKFFLERIADTTPDLLWVYDIPEGKNVYINRRVTTMLGYGIEYFQSLPGDLTDSLVHPDDLQTTREWYARFDAAGEREVREIETRLRHADGSYRWTLARATAFERAPDGRVRQIIGVSSDITERKQQEEELRRLTDELESRVDERTVELVQSQDRLRALAMELNLAEQRERKRLAGELHDYLAQLLVLGCLKLGQVRRAGLPSKAEETVKETEEVLTKALDYSRTLMAELSPPIVQEHGLLAGLKWLGEQIQRHGLMVKVEVGNASEVSLANDCAMLLFQSVRELLMNALKHASCQKVVIRLQEDERRLCIEVRDDGIGFDLAAAGSFSTAMSSKFGLFSIRERMTALGGHFDLHSAPGGGTTATLVLPLGNASAAKSGMRNEELGIPGKGTEVGNQPSDHSTFQQDTKLIRVLLVDDHAMVRQGLRTVLDSYPDLDVVGEAWNGKEAVASAERLQPSIIVMDINMPKMNGIDATAEITSRYPDIAVIGLSVQAGGANVEAMRQAGAAMLLTKEAAVDELYQAIREALKGKALGQKNSLEC